MRTWLKLIGSAEKPITDPPFNGNYNSDHIGFRKANKPGIRRGDHLFLYAPGGSRRIFALAEAIGDPEPKKEGDCQWRIHVRFLINLPVASGLLIDDVSSERNLTKSIQQASHIQLLPEESQSAYSNLISNYAPILFPDELGAVNSYWEGALRRITINAYERDYAARQECIAHFGASCQVCGLDFEKTYGEIGRGFIHVHHTRPLSEVRSGYAVDPLRDLVPVCPNCHAMLHQISPPLSISESRQRLDMERPSRTLRTQYRNRI